MPEAIAIAASSAARLPLNSWGAIRTRISIGFHVDTYGCEDDHRDDVCPPEFHQEPDAAPCPAVAEDHGHDDSHHEERDETEEKELHGASSGGACTLRRRHRPFVG